MLCHHVLAVMVVGLCAGIKMSRIAFERDLIGISGSGVVGDHLCRMHTADEIVFAVDDSPWLSVKEKQVFHRTGVGNEEQLFALRFLRHGDSCLYPDILIFAAPPLRGEGHGFPFSLRRETEMLFCFKIQSIRNGKKSFVNQLCVYVVCIFQLVV